MLGGTVHLLHPLSELLQASVKNSELQDSKLFLYELLHHLHRGGRNCFSKVVGGAGLYGAFRFTGIQTIPLTIVNAPSPVLVGGLHLHWFSAPVGPQAPRRQPSASCFLFLPHPAFHLLTCLWTRHASTPPGLLHSPHLPVEWRCDGVTSRQTIEVIQFKRFKSSRSCVWHATESATLSI